MSKTEEAIASEEYFVTKKASDKEVWMEAWKSCYEFLQGREIKSMELYEAVKDTATTKFNQWWDGK